MDLILLTYNFLFTTILGISTLMNAKTQAEYFFSALFLPLSLYFGNRLFKFVLLRAKLVKVVLRRRKRRNHAESPDSTLATREDNALEGEVVEGGIPVRDRDKRLFLKLVASSGLSLFFLAVLGKKSAQAAFFGSVPGPGTVAIKDSSGNQIDPAEKQPTDGYEIAQIDDTSSSDYAYYGFVDKDGRWYITRENLTGANAGQYLYVADTSGFSTNWTDRATLSYTTFDSAF